MLLEVGIAAGAGVGGLREPACLQADGPDLILEPGVGGGGVFTQVPALCKTSLCCILKGVHVSTCIIHFNKKLHRTLHAEVALKSN